LLSLPHLKFSYNKRIANGIDDVQRSDKVRGVIVKRLTYETTRKKQERKVDGKKDKS
jgi:hypothetical protein